MTAPINTTKIEITDLLSAVAHDDIQAVAKISAATDATLIKRALHFAVFRHSDIQIVSTLIALHPRTDCSALLLGAIQRRNFDAFDCILAHADPNESKQQVMHEAVMYGYLSCVRQLLKQCRIDTYGYQLLAQACFNGHSEMVDLLYDLCDPHQALDFLNTEKVPEANRQLIVQRMEQEQQRQRLMQCMNTQSLTLARKI
jgi:ankyrin repeat protein